MFYPKDDHIYDELLDIVVSATVVKGEADLVQDCFGFYFTAGVSGEEVCFVYRMRQVLADKIVGTGQDIQSGDRLFWIPGQDAVSQTPVGVVGTDCYFVGWAKEDASENDTQVLMNFDGTRYDEVIAP